MGIPTAAFDSLPATKFITGEWGDIDQSFDFGFIPCPQLSAVGTGPSSCELMDATIALTLTNVPDGSYTINYEDELGDPQTFTNVVVTSGSATITGLGAGDYNNVSITVNSCTSIFVDVVLSSNGPTLSAVSINPSLCGASDGLIMFTFTNVPDGNYTIDYEDENLASQSFTNVDVISGEASILNLGAGVFNSLSITITGCTSNLSNIELTETCDYDFGDLPDTDATTGVGNYQTDTLYGGPAHLIIPGLYLGNSVDFETNGSATVDADGDDSTDSDDEDGLAFPSSMNLIINGSLNIPFSATNTTGNTAYVEMWIDWNGDGDFDESNELVTDINDGVNPFPNFLSLTIPEDAVTNQNLGLRIRLSNEGDMSPYGIVQSGEVEDYLIKLACDTQKCVSIETLINTN